MTDILHLDVSDHAVDRYRERFDRDLSVEEARERVRDIFRGAKRLHAQGSDRAIYGGLGGARLVVRHPGTARAAVLTVLFPYEEMDEREGYEPDPPTTPGHAALEAVSKVNKGKKKEAHERLQETQKALAESERENRRLKHELEEALVLRGQKFRAALHEAREAATAREQVQNKRLVGIIQAIVNGNERVFVAAKKVFANAKTGICPEIDADGNFV